MNESTSVTAAAAAVSAAAVAAAAVSAAVSAAAVAALYSSESVYSRARTCREGPRHPRL